MIFKWYSHKSNHEITEFSKNDILKKKKNLILKKLGKEKKPPEICINECQINEDNTTSGNFSHPNFRR